MSRNPEVDKMPPGFSAAYGAYLGLGVYSIAQVFRSIGRQNGWEARLDSLDAHVDKVRKDLKGPFHHLAVVDIGLTKQKIAEVQANPPKGPEGVQVIEGMAPLVLGGAVIGTAVAYALRRI